MNAVILIFNYLLISILYLNAQHNTVPSFRKEKVLLTAMGAFAYVPVQLVGVLRVGEIIALIYVILSFPTVIKLINSNKYISRYSLLMFFWLLLGYISSLVNNIDDTALLKGIANIAVIFTTFITFFLLLRKNLGIVIYFLVPFGIGTFFYSPFSYGGADDRDFELLRSLGSEDSDNYFDVFIAPFATPLVLAYSLFFHKKTTSVTVICFLYGLTAVYWDAKAIGLVFMLGSILYFLKNINFKFTKQKIRVFLIIFPLVILPVLYYAISNRVFSDNISDNLEDTKKFNPFLLVGRPDPIIGLIAIADKPLLGHGFNNTESKYTGLAIEMGYLPSNYYTRYSGILDHSCFLHSIIEGGIVSGFIWIFVLAIATEMLPIVYKTPRNKFTMLICFSFFYMFWNILLSPISRTETGYLLAVNIIFIAAYKQKKKSEIQKKEILPWIQTNLS